MDDEENIVTLAVMDISGLNGFCTRDDLKANLDMPMETVDRILRRLIDMGKIFRVQRGIFKPVRVFHETRPISVTSVPDGELIVEIGDLVIKLNPQEARTLGLLLSGFGVCLSNSSSAREVSEAVSLLRKGGCCGK